VRVLVHVGRTADDRAAQLDGCDQDVFAAGVVEQAFLGEGAELEVDGPGVVALETQQGADAGQADAGIEWAMGRKRGIEF
jgi:hypothetical protein